MSDAAIKLKGLNFHRRGQVILEQVDLELERGAFLGLIGPNGAGKTVLLKLLLGLLKPTSGSIEILGGSVEASRGKVGYVPQFARFESQFPTTVMDAVLMGRLAHAAYGRPFSRADREIALQTLERVELADLRGRELSKLSGGQIQRVLIARALAVQPQLLLLDEPTASLDTRVGRTVYDLLDELAPEMTIVLVSHDIGVIASHVKTIACLNRRLHYHHTKDIAGEVLAEVYGCPVELIAHGHAHRVLPHHHHHEPKE